MVVVISLSGYVAGVWGENGSEGDGDGDCKKVLLVVQKFESTIRNPHDASNSYHSYSISARSYTAQEKTCWWADWGISQQRSSSASATRARFRSSTSRRSIPYAARKHQAGHQ